MKNLTASPCVLGIDIGTTTVKAVLFDRYGSILQSAQAEYPTYFPQRGWVEQDPNDWWNVLTKVIQQITAASASRSLSIQAIGVSSQAPAFIPMARDGKPLDRAMIWMDRRAGAEADWLKSQIGEEKMLEYSGNRVDPFYTAAKLLWYKNNKPALYHNIHKVLQVNGYINFRLTDVYSMDQAHASITQFYDVPNGLWADDVLKQCGVNLDIFPRIYASTDIIGEVSAKASCETGLAQGIPVIAGTVDGAAAALEAGIIKPGVGVEMTGTSSVLITSTEKHVRSRELISMKHALPDMTLCLGAMTSTGASLKWFRDQFCPAEAEAGTRLGLDSYDLMNLEAERTAPKGDLLFLPYMMGERSPIWDSDARGVFFGLSLKTTRAEMIRAIMEGSAFALRHNVEAAQHLGTRMNTLRIIGGAARSMVWNQIKADVLGREMDVIEGSGGAPLGNAILAGMAAGLYPGPQAVLDQVISLQKKIVPNDKLHSFYDKKYGIYLQLYKQLESQFKQLSAVMEGENE